MKPEFKSVGTWYGPASGHILQLPDLNMLIIDWLHKTCLIWESTFYLYIAPFIKYKTYVIFTL